MRNIRSCLLIVLIFQLAACAVAPDKRAPIIEGYANPQEAETFSAYQSKNLLALEVARQQIGLPYRYGGESPAGFDCSGLMKYAFQQAGIQLPRTAAAQFDVAQAVSMHELQPGDVIFFKISRNKISHVGIYAGAGQFIHAPSSGKRVTTASLSESYWQKRLVKTGRFY